MQTSTSHPSGGVMQGRHYFAGHGHSATATFESTRPARPEEVIGAFPRGDAALANAAVDAARKAYPAWRRTSRIRRAELFDELAQLVKRETDNLARLMAR